MVAPDYITHQFNKTDVMDDYKNEAFLKRKLSENGLLLKYYPRQMKNKIEYVLVAVNNNPWALVYASNKLKNNKSVVKKALKRDGRVLQFASRKLQADIELVKFANAREWPELFNGF